VGLWVAGIVQGGAVGSIGGCGGVIGGWVRCWGLGGVEDLEGLAARIGLIVLGGGGAN
jgi:hypothetical protein